MKIRALLLLMTAMVVAVIYITPTSGSSVARLVKTTTAPKSASAPAVVGSFAKLRSLISQMESVYLLFDDTAVLEAAPRAAVAASAVAGATAADQAAGYSATNIQVAGVDEADIVKTDGRYIYRVAGDRVVIVRADQPERLRITNTLELDQEGFSPTMMYVDDGLLVIIGDIHQTEPQFNDNPEKSDDVLSGVPAFSGGVKAIVYDTTDMSRIRLVREFEVEGAYLSSRKIGSALYLIANRYLDTYRIMEEPPAQQTAKPTYSDSAVSSQRQVIDYDEINYLPEPAEPNYLIVAGIDLDDPDRPADITTLLGGGQNIYASTESLYVATGKADGKTAIYKFALSGARTRFSADGEVPGRLLNQFSMDEHDGHLRLATTTERYAPAPGDAEIAIAPDSIERSNAVIVMNQELKIVGEIDNIAPGERIYSARFMGERAYMVTFKTVDPLFVIDLANPAAPRILGELKIPGYSDYLHPYDENHIIGFGKDTIETEGFGGESIALYQGIKVAMFDVSDVSRPVEKFKEIIGVRGTESELLYNHKALLFDRSKNLLAFPVNLHERRDPLESGFNEYGRFSWQGLYVYHVDQEGLTLRDRITHVSVSPYGDGASSRFIDRALFIDNTLYATSLRQITSHNLGDLREIDRVDLGASAREEPGGIR